MVGYPRCDEISPSWMASVSRPRLGFGMQSRPYVPGDVSSAGLGLVGKVSPRIRSAVLYNFLPLLCDREGDIRARVDLLNGGIVNKSGFIFGQGGERGSRESLIDENRRGRGSRIRRTSVNIKRRETKRYDK